MDNLLAGVRLFAVALLLNVLFLGAMARMGGGQEKFCLGGSFSSPENLWHFSECTVIVGSLDLVGMNFSLNGASPFKSVIDITGYLRLSAVNIDTDKHDAVDFRDVFPGLACIHSLQLTHYSTEDDGKPIQHLAAVLLEGTNIDVNATKSTSMVYVERGNHVIFRHNVHTCDFTSTKARESESSDDDEHLKAFQLTTPDYRGIFSRTGASGCKLKSGEKKVACPIFVGELHLKSCYCPNLYRIPRGKNTEFNASMDIVQGHCLYKCDIQANKADTDFNPALPSCGKDCPNKLPPVFSLLDACRFRYCTNVTGDVRISMDHHLPESKMSNGRLVQRPWCAPDADTIEEVLGRAFSVLRTIRGHLYITGNECLRHINFLSDQLNVTGGIYIQNNPYLTSANICTNKMAGLVISSNPRLCCSNSSCGKRFASDCSKENGMLGFCNSCLTLNATVKSSSYGPSKVIFDTTFNANRKQCTATKDMWLVVLYRVMQSKPSCGESAFRKLSSTDSLTCGDNTGSWQSQTLPMNGSIELTVGTANQLLPERCYVSFVRGYSSNNDNNELRGDFRSNRAYFTTRRATELPPISSVELEQLPLGSPSRKVRVHLKVILNGSHRNRDTNIEIHWHQVSNYWRNFYRGQQTCKEKIPEDLNGFKSSGSKCFASQWPSLKTDNKLSVTSTFRSLTINGRNCMGKNSASSEDEEQEGYMTECTSKLGEEFTPGTLLAAMVRWSSNNLTSDWAFVDLKNSWIKANEIGNSPLNVSWQEQGVLKWSFDEQLAAFSFIVLFKPCREDSCSKVNATDRLIAMQQLKASGCRAASDKKGSSCPMEGMCGIECRTACEGRALADSSPEKDTQCQLASIKRVYSYCKEVGCNVDVRPCSLENLISCHQPRGASGTMSTKQQCTTTPTASPSPGSHTTQPSSSSSLPTAAVVLVATVLPLAVLVCVVLWLYQRNKRKKYKAKWQSQEPYEVPAYVQDEWEVDLGSIQMDQALGEGAFGLVYRGHLNGSIVVAIKTLKSELATDRDLFLQEASVMKKFDSPFVVKLLGIVSLSSKPMVIMEFMGNGDLKNYLRKTRPLPSAQKLGQIIRFGSLTDSFDSQQSRQSGVEMGSGQEPLPSVKQFLRWANELACGMQHLVERKYVHRDLSARNCMLSEDLHLKVGDFGLTRDIYQESYYRKRGKGALPLRWLPPEALRDGLYTSATDVWSYGIVLWEMATLAELPYQGKSNEETMEFILHGGHMNLPVVGHDFPALLNDIMLACWSYQPDLRPTFSQIITAISTGSLPELIESAFPPAVPAPVFVPDTSFDITKNKPLIADHPGEELLGNEYLQPTNSTAPPQEKNIAVGHLNHGDEISYYENPLALEEIELTSKGRPMSGEYAEPLDNAVEANSSSDTCYEQPLEQAVSSLPIDPLMPVNKADDCEKQPDFQDGFFPDSVNARKDSNETCKTALTLLCEEDASLPPPGPAPVLSNRDDLIREMMLQNKDLQNGFSAQY